MNGNMTKPDGPHRHCRDCNVLFMPSGPYCKVCDDCKKRNHAEANRKLAANPDWRKKTAEAARKRSANPEWRKKMQKVFADPEWQKRHAEGLRNRSANPEWRTNQSEAMRKLHASPQWRKNQSEAMQRYHARKYTMNLLETMQKIESELQEEGR